MMKNVPQQPIFYGVCFVFDVQTRRDSNVSGFRTYALFPLNVSL